MERERPFEAREEDLSKEGSFAFRRATHGQLVLKAPGMEGTLDHRYSQRTTIRRRVIFHFMNGQFVFKNAVVRFMIINEGLEANNLQVSDIDMLIPHQANLRGFPNFIQKKFGLNDDQSF